MVATTSVFDSLEIIKLNYTHFAKCIYYEAHLRIDSFCELKKGPTAIVAWYQFTEFICIVIQHDEDL